MDGSSDALELKREKERSREARKQGREIGYRLVLFFRGEDFVERVYVVDACTRTSTVGTCTVPLDPNDVTPMAVVRACAAWSFGRRWTVGVRTVGSCDVLCKTDLTSYFCFAFCWRSCVFIFFVAFSPRPTTISYYPTQYNMNFFHHNLFLLWVVSAAHALTTTTTGGTNNGSLLSRLETAQCALQVSVGRIPGTAMPPEWAASGAKLGFPLEIEFAKELCSDFDMNKERLLQGDAANSISNTKKNNFRAVVPLNEPSFISNLGQETILVNEGAYGFEVQNLEAQQYSLRFCLDFPQGAVRNDCSLPAERIYFLTSCWIENRAVLERAQKRKDETETSLQETIQELQQIQQDSSTANFVQKAMGIRQTVLLVEKKQRLEVRLNELEQTYPLQSDLLLEGPKGVVFVKEGVIAVKRFRGAMNTREQYHWVGTFAFQEFFEDEDEDE
jgi:hypothetical protein